MAATKTKTKKRKLSAATIRITENTNGTVNIRTTFQPPVSDDDNLHHPAGATAARMLGSLSCWGEEAE